MTDAQNRGWGPPCPDGEIVNIQAGGRSFNVHKKVAPIFQAFITDLVATPYPIDRGTLDDWSYNCRKIAGSTSWSNHAWGLAVDINSLTNPMRSPLTTDMPSWVRNETNLMNKYGLRWGGEYSGTPDPMHFEFMLTPADADRIASTLHGGGEWWTMSIPQSELDKIQKENEQALASSAGQDAIRNAVGAEFNEWFSWRPPPLSPNTKPWTLTELLGVWANAGGPAILANQNYFKGEIPGLTDDEKNIIDAIQRSLNIAVVQLTNTIEQNAGKPMTDEQVTALAKSLADELVNAGLPQAFITAFGEELLD